MKHLSTLSLILFFNLHVYAQQIQWAKKGISPGFENGNGITCDIFGNVYAAGQIEYTTDFDGTLVSSKGSHDIVVVKYDHLGIIKWIRTAGGPAGDVANAIAVDANQNVYVAGELEDDCDFGSGIVLNTAGSNDIFLAKYDAGGTIQWAKRWGTSDNEKALGVAVGPSGDVYLTGYFSSSVTFSGTTLHSSGRREIFLAKFSPGGSLIWAKKAGGSLDDKAEGITVDKDENIYLVGSFTSSASFGSTNISNSGNNSAFVVKYNSNGSAQWAKAAGDCCDTTQYRSVAVDDNGNVYTAGYFNDDSNISGNHFNSVGSSDVVIAKYNSTGNLEWARHGGGTGEDVAYGIAVDTINDKVYVTGYVSGAGNFDSFNYTISGFKDIFVVAYDTGGNILWNKISGGSHRDIGASVSVDNSGNIYTTGLFNGTAYFDTHVLTGYPNQPWADFFVYKISIAPVVPPAIPASNLIVTQATCSDLNISFTPGDGDARIVIVHSNGPVDQDPVNGIAYHADPNFGNGSDLGNGNFVVFNGTGNSVTVTGLSPGGNYYFSVIEYNGTGTANNFAVATPLTGSGTTANFTINLTGLHEICLGDTVELEASGATDYTWLPAAGLSATTGTHVIASPQSTTIYTINATTSASCAATLFFRVTVNPLPALSFPDLNDICENALPIFLVTGDPAGGVYSGPGVSNGQFDPVAAGPGDHTLIYTYTDAIGCSNNNPAEIHVNTLPNVSLAPVNPLCTGDNAINLSGNPSGGIFIGQGVIGNDFDPSIGPGSYQVQYSYTDNDGCSESTSETIIVNATPVVNLGSDLNVCAQNTLQLNAGNGFASYLWSDGSQNPYLIVDSSGVGLDSENFSVIVTTAEGCSSEDEIEITFDLCSGIEGNAVSKRVQVYPNPFRNVITIDSPEKISYKIYDLQGRLLIYEKENRGTMIEGFDLMPGNYLLEIISGNDRHAVQIVKLSK